MTVKLQTQEASWYHLSQRAEEKKPLSTVLKKKKEIIESLKL